MSQVPRPEARLHVGYVVTVYPRLSETFIAQEIAGLERRGLSLTIFSQKPPAPDATPVAVGTRSPQLVLETRAPRAFVATLWDHLELIATRPRRYVSLLRWALGRGNRAAWKKFWRAGRLARECERRRVRHLHAHFLSGNTRVARLAAELAQLTYSLTAHAKDIYAAGLTESKVRRRIDGAAFAITVSEHNREHLQRLTDPARIVVIRNGVDLQRSPFRDEAKRRSDVVLAVGRLVPKKGFDVLVAAIAELVRGAQPVTAWFVGGGPEESRLRALAATLGIEARITFLGPLAHDEVLARMAEATLLAVPSVIAADGDRDGLPTVIPEAMAAGLPVVAARTAGIPEIVLDGETGFLVEPGDPRALAAAIARLVADPAWARQVARAARVKVEAEYDLERNVERLHGHFAALAGNGKGAA